MVPYSRAALRAHQLRPLNNPLPINVSCDDHGFPVDIRLKGRTRKVKAIKDCWRIDDEWWRTPLSRRYYWVEYVDGALETVYLDLISRRWFRQRDSYVR